MMNNLSILWQNKGFMAQAYGFNGIMGVILILALVDLALKGWALWRAAIMRRQWWFIALLLVNSLGLFPAIFLIATNAEYERKSKVA